MPKSRFSYKARATQFLTPPPSNSVSPEPHLNWHPTHMQQQQQQHAFDDDNTWSAQNAAMRRVPYARSAPASRSDTPNAERAAHSTSSHAASRLHLTSVPSNDSVLSGMGGKMPYGITCAPSPVLSPTQSHSILPVLCSSTRPPVAATGITTTTVLPNQRVAAAQQYMMDSAASYAAALHTSGPSPLVVRRLPAVTSPTPTDKYLRSISAHTGNARAAGPWVVGASGQQQQQQQFNLTPPDTLSLARELSSSAPASVESIVNVICDLLAEADAIGSSMAAAGPATGQTGLVAPALDTKYGLSRMYTY